MLHLRDSVYTVENFFVLVPLFGNFTDYDHNLRVCLPASFLLIFGLYRFVSVVKLAPISVRAIKVLVEVFTFFCSVVGWNMRLLKQFMSPVCKGAF